MRLPRQLGLRLRSLLLRRRVESELDEELSYHLEREIEARRAKGDDPQEARYAALRSMEGIALQKEVCREMRGTTFIDNTIQDLGYALRSLRHSPGFASIVVLTLALAIGANTAIFSLVYSVILRPFPYPDLDRLVAVQEVSGKDAPMSLSWLDFVDLRAQLHGITNLAAAQSRNVTFRRGGHAERRSVLRVSSPYFSLLGMHPLLGRDFLASDDRAGAAPAALLSHTMWQEGFDSDPQVVGKGVNLDGKAYTIIGVLPPFKSAFDADVYLPISLNAAKDFGGRGNHPGIFALGRLRPGSSLAVAKRDLRDVSKRLEQAYPVTNAGVSATAEPFARFVAGDARGTLFALWGAVGLVLLIACANVANLLLARAVTREREVAIRIAIGAGRGRIVRQLLTECGLLAVLGAAGGLGLARGALPLMLRLVPDRLASLADAAVNGGVLWFTVGLVVSTTLLFGLAPALRLARRDPERTLRATGRVSSASFRAFSTRGLLVSMQVALAFMLLASAGLLIRSLMRLAQVDPGFRTDHMLTMSFRMPLTKYPHTPQQTILGDQVLERIRSIPGVTGASGAYCLPLDPRGCWSSVMVLEGRPIPRPDDMAWSQFNGIEPGYLRTMGIPLIEGREFDERDGPDTPMVLMVNQSFVRKFYPNEDPIGKRVKQDYPQGSTPYATIVGIMGDVRRDHLDKPPQPEAFESLRQMGPDVMNLVVRTSLADPQALASSIRREISGLDPDVIVFGVRPMEYYVGAQKASRRFPMVLLAAFAGLALFLASIGLYGLLSFLVTQRTPEIGIRLALGARPPAVSAMILRQGAGLAMGGLVAGLLGALAATRLFSALLFGVPPWDVATLAGVGCLLAVIAAIACWLPAHRASKVDPMIALRAE